MSASRQKWLSGLQSSSLFRPPPQNANQEHTEVLAYVELLGQFAAESFVDDIGELVRSHYPSEEICLLDDVLASFVLHHPEHGHAVLHALLSCVIDATIVYNKKNPPFRAFISLFSPSTERDFSEQWALACGEILRILTHYNRPTFQPDNGPPSGSHISPSINGEGAGKGSLEDSRDDRGRKLPARLLTPWITDSLLAASPPIRNDYFRWCGGAMGKYTAGEELRPPTTVGHGKQPQLLPSTPRWAVAYGAAVILSVCDDEVARYETADLTASAVPALLLRPPPPTLQDDHLVALGLPALEPFSRLFHRYYAIATPGATQRLLFGLLEAPPIGAPQGFLVVVELMDILHIADDCSSSVQLPHDWVYIHFLKPIGVAMAVRSETVADTAAALLYHIFAEPALLVPPSHFHSVSSAQSLYGCATLSSGIGEAQVAASQASENATARGLAALMVGHGPHVEQRICALWEAALGLQTVSPNVVDLPKVVLSTSLQPPALSWNMVRPLLRILEYLPVKSESRNCLMRIYTATVKAILQQTFPREEVMKHKDDSQRDSQRGVAGTKVVGMAELRAMVHYLFTESFLPPILAAQLLADALTLCLSHDAKREVELRKALRTETGGSFSSVEREGPSSSKEVHGPSSGETGARGAVATFDSYVVAAVCALACEVRLVSFSPSYFAMSVPAPVALTRTEGNEQVSRSGLEDARKSSGALPDGFRTGVVKMAEHTKRLGLLELLLGGTPSSGGTSISDNTTSMVTLGNSVVAAHMSALLGQSRACLHSLAEIMKCKWDPGICAQAAAVVARIENGSDLGSMASHGKNSDCSLGVMPQVKEEGSDVAVRESDWASKTLKQDLHKDGALQKSPNRPRWMNLLNGQRLKSHNGVIRGHMGKQVVTLPLEAADVVTLLCTERWNGHSAAVTSFLRPLMAENPHLAIASVALLCERLVFSPDIPNSSEGTFAEHSWHQVVEALRNMVASIPERVAPFIVAQAETQLQPWITKEHVQNQKSVWRVNTRIVSLLSALLRLRNIPYVVKVVVQDCALLRRATDGLMIDVEACTLPQLELLDAAAVAAQAALQWDEPHEEIADMLFVLLRERLPATVRCLSHSSAHVRAMSMSRLMDMPYFEAFRTSYFKEGWEEGDTKVDENMGSNYWRIAVEKCIKWEAHYRRASGLSISFLANAATALGCSIPS